VSRVRSGPSRAQGFAFVEMRDKSFEGKVVGHAAGGHATLAAVSAARA